jgi:hypothetical protein
VKMMKRRFVLIFLLVLALFSGACVVHHHHHHDKDEQAETSVSHREQSPQDEPREDSEPVREAPQRVLETAASETAASEAATPAPQPSENEGELLSGCQVRSYPSGWIDASCGSMQIFVLTGPAAQRDDDLLLELAAEHTSRILGDGSRPGWTWSKAGTARMQAGTFALRSAVFKNRQKSGGLGFAPPKDHPEIYAEALAVVAPTSHGRAAMICSEEGDLDKERCLEFFDDLTHEPLGRWGASSDDVVSIAGVPMRFKESCFYNQPEALVCPMASSVDWVSGTPAQAKRALDQSISIYTDDRGIEGFHNPHRQYECRIGDNPATCHEVDLQGVLDTPHRVLYLALVDAPDANYFISCNVRVEEQMSEPCQLLFGGQTSERYH